MAIAKGRSTIRAEIDLMEQSLKQMIDSVESHFADCIGSLRARIDDVECGSETTEEKRSICESYLSKMSECEDQRFHVRNKLVIVLYSICEASLAGICFYYHIPLKHSPQNQSKRHYYLSDYLFSLGIDYIHQDNSNSAYVVNFAIRELRNCLTHCGQDNEKVSNAVGSMKNAGFIGIENDNGVILIQTVEVLYKMLNCCKDMLIVSENKAQTIK